MNFPENIKYNKEHLWIKVDNNEAFIGITDFAQNQLEEIIFVELPEIDNEFEAGDEFSVVESSKNASSLAAPFKIKILEVNERLDDEPEYLNEDPYDGWIVKVQIIDDNDAEKLMDNNVYKELVTK